MYIEPVLKTYFAHELQQIVAKAPSIEGVAPPQFISLYDFSETMLLLLQ